MKNLTPLQMQYLVISINKEAEEMENEKNEIDNIDMGSMRKGQKPNIAKSGLRSKMKEKIQKRGQ